MTQMKENVNGIDRYHMYIDGQWVDSSSNETIEVLNPTNEEVIATVPDASVEDGRRALGSSSIGRLWPRFRPQAHPE